MIALEGVWRTYAVGGTPLHALAGVDLVIERGEHLAIMGPSGSGKSTLLNILGGLDRPTAGTYRFGDRDVTKLDEQQLSLLRRNEVGHVFQAYHLVPRLDAFHNAELPLVFAGAERRDRRRRVEEALRSVGLEKRARHRPSELSGGEQQRVAIARAIVMQPAVLLADEPTGNLDRTSGDQILALLDHLHEEGLTLVVVTHDPAVARRAEHVLILEDGRVARHLRGEQLTSVAEALAGHDGEGP
ncbi:MAG: ABC transporter ATP-binding protein [Planctomycetes bacterium]|nr:ABC transporter ATP-binding protein [Planctomycetota bacterium]